jgi:N-acyl-D-amino-acid deacylase
MAADVTVFDPQRVVDHATYEAPTLRSEGIRHVIVNGRMAIRDGQIVGERAGRILARTRHMPSRPMSADVVRGVSARTQSDATLELDVRQGAGARVATGVFRFRDSGKNLAIESTELGIVQVTERWATFSGRARVSASGGERPFMVIVDQVDPFRSDMATIWIRVAGFPDTAVPLLPEAVKITPATH